MKKTALFLVFLIFLHFSLFPIPLPIPPVLSEKSASLFIQKGSLALPWGTSETYGYNGNYLVPTL